MNHKYTKYLFLTLVLLGNTISGAVFAGTLTNVMITPLNNLVSETTTYTVSFTVNTPIAAGQFITLVTNGCNPQLSSCVRFDGPQPMTLGIVNAPVSLTQIIVRPSGLISSTEIIGGTAASGVTVSYDIPGVSNPTITGLSNTFTLRLLDSGSNILDESNIVSGINIVGNGGPSVSRFIPDANINQDDGTITLDLDTSGSVDTNLNNSFMDDNGQTLTYAIDSVTDSTVVTAAISGNTVTLTGLKTGTADVTISATDTDMNSVTDTFTVNVVGALNPSSVSPTSLVAGDTTNYTISFKPAVVLGAGDKVTLTGGSIVDFLGATFVSISGGTLGVSGVSPVNAGQTLEVSLTGSASTSDTVSLVIGNITNPGAAGLSAAYVLETQAAGINGRSTVVGNTFTAATVPTISNTIPSISILQEDGAFTVDLDADAGVETDLDYTFGGNPPLTFTIDSQTNTAAATVVVDNNTLLLTPQGTGVTTITVKATDMVNAFITTSFNVVVLGSLAPASVTPSSQFTGVTTSYTITLTPNETLAIGDRIRLSTFTGFNQTSSALVSLTGGTAVTGTKTGGNSTETIVTIDSGSVVAGTLVTMELSGILNPSSVGMSDDYQVYTDDGTSTSNTGVSTVSGHVFSVSSVNIFANGFEDPVVVMAAKNTVALVNKLFLTQDAITDLSVDTSQYQFMGESLSLKINGNVRSMDSVIWWYEQVLADKSPLGDFDQDGINNEQDVDPLGLTMRGNRQ